MNLLQYWTMLFHVAQFVREICHLYFFFKKKVILNGLDINENDKNYSDFVCNTIQ